MGEYRDTLIFVAKMGILFAKYRVQKFLDPSFYRLFASPKIF